MKEPEAFSTCVTKNCFGLSQEERGGGIHPGLTRPKHKGGSGRVLPKSPKKPNPITRDYPNSMKVFTAMAASEPTTINLIMFFINRCSINMLLVTVWFRVGMTQTPSSSAFVLPVCMRVTCAQLLVQKYFLSGSLSCSAKTLFPPATLSVLFPLLLFSVSGICDVRTIWKAGSLRLTIVDKQLT